MGKKSILWIVLLLTLVTGGHSANAALALKPGAACTKVGVTSIASGVKYTCIRSGKKLVWDKGVKVTANPSTSTYTYRPALKLDLENLDPNEVRKAAYSEVIREYLSQAPYVAPITYLNGPNVKAVNSAQELPGIERSSRFWGDIFQPTKIFVSYVVSSDADWIDPALCKAANYCFAKDPMAHEWGSNMKRYPQNCTGGEANMTPEKLPLLVQCIGPGNEDIQNRQTGPHEYLHLVQQSYKQFGDAPRWFLEGSAIYFGGTIGLLNAYALPSKLDYVLGYDEKSWRSQTLCDASKVTVSAVVDCFKFSYLNGSPVPSDKLWQISNTSYYPGSLATEALVAVYGVKKVKELIKELGQTNFDSAFLKVYGVTVDYAYPKLGKYVVAMNAVGK